MDNLIKAMHCCIYDCDGVCNSWVDDQSEYFRCEASTLMPLAIQKIIDLQRSNGKWRRKAQGVRKEIKKVKEKENV